MPRIMNHKHPNLTHWIPGWSAFGLFVFIYIIIGIIMAEFMHTNKNPMAVIVLLAAGFALDFGIYRLIKRSRRNLTIPKFNIKHELKRIGCALLIIFSSEAIIPNLILLIGKSLGPLHLSQHIQTNQSFINQVFTNGTSSAIGITVLGILVSPIAEEFLFRAMLIGPKPGQINKRKVTKAHRLTMTVLAIIFFTLIHVLNQSVQFNYTGLILTLVDIAKYGILATVFSTAYYQSGNLLDSISIHASWNTISFLMLAKMAL